MSKFCSNCGNPISNQTKFCPSCGCCLSPDLVADKGELRKPSIKYIFAGVLCALVILFLTYNITAFKKPDEKPVEQPTTTTVQNDLVKREANDNSTTDNAVKQNTESVDIKTSNDPAQIDNHWIMDSRSGCLLWNPNPNKNETVAWTGGYFNKDGIKYADGYGKAIWYINGEFEQNDEGTYHIGKRDGRIVQRFPDGRVQVSQWKNGQKIN